MQKPTFSEEKLLWKRGYTHIIGIDEVGRGAFAGPLVVGAVVFSKHFEPKFELKEVNDSKLLSPLQRVRLNKVIRKYCNLAATVHVGVPKINRIGIGKATSHGMRNVVSVILNKLPKNSHPFLLVDGFHVKYIEGIGLKHQKAIIKGDRISFSIASASIIAKVERDRHMKLLHKRFNFYGFSKNKGYGTKFHQKAIAEHGLCALHRTSFSLLKFTKKSTFPS